MNSLFGQTALEAGQLDCYFALINPAQRIHNSEFEALLSPIERERYQQISAPDQRQEYLCARALLRSVLSLYGDKAPGEWLFEYDRFGKPTLSNAEGLELNFNLSQAVGVVACVVSRGQRIGIDLEYHPDGEAMLEVADNYLAPAEIEALDALPKPERVESFFRYWTLKEAYLKARGEGQSGLALDSFAFAIDEQAVAFTAPPGDEGQWYFESIRPAADYSAAIAVEGEPQTLRFFQCQPLVSVQALDGVDSLWHSLSNFPAAVG